MLLKQILFVKANVEYFNDANSINMIVNIRGSIAKVQMTDGEKWMKISDLYPANSTDHLFWSCSYAPLCFFIPSTASFVPEPVKISRISFQDGTFALVEDNGFRLPCPAKDK